MIRKSVDVQLNTLFIMRNYKLFQKFDNNLNNNNFLLQNRVRAITYLSFKNFCSEKVNIEDRASEFFGYLRTNNIFKDQKILEDKKYIS